MAKNVEIMAEILDNLGFDKAIINKLKSDKEDDWKDIDPGDASDAIVTTQRTIAQSDESFTSPLIKEAFGKSMGSLERKVLANFKDFGLTNAEMEALPKDGRLEALIGLARKKVDEKKGSADDKDKEITKLNEIIGQKDDEIKDLKEVQLPAAKTEAQTKLKEKQKLDLVRSAFDKLSLGEDKSYRLVADAEVLFPGAKAKFDALYDVNIKDDDTVQILMKGTQTPAFVKSKAVTLESAFDAINTELNIYKKSEPLPAKPPIKGKGPGAGGEAVEKFHTHEHESKLAQEIESRKAAQGS